MTSSRVRYSPSCMYGPVSDTSRSPGVRHCPFMSSTLGSLAATSAARSYQRWYEVSGGASLKEPVRLNPFALSFLDPSQAPHGRQLVPATQSATEPATPSASVGTAAPTCGTPTLWKSPSEKSGVL